ncbi:MAG: cysteine desulfurase-like protein [Acidothermales bacterium]|jgi:cysteine desulfurase family protein (TIGR01976 family)|nr:cysteine desulfurase-like protein [Acidothermales bacterium]
MSYDVDAVRKLYPALAEGLAHFDSPGGTQVPEPVSDAVAASLRSAVSNSHGAFASSARADATVDAARVAVADLVGGDPRGVLVGPSMTALTYRLATALSRRWSAADEIIVTRLDHDANVRPWVQAAARAGATVRWADIDSDTCELPLEQFESLIGEATALVAVTGASNAVGTRPDVRAIADLAHAVGALVHVDGVHLTPHAFIDMAELGADFFACSSYKFCGPHLGMTTASPELLESLEIDKLLPSPAEVPQRFEYGTSQFELLAGLPATVDYLAGLVPGKEGSRRERLRAALAAVAEYEDGLFAALYDGLRGMEGVTVYGHAARRTPTVAFRVAGHSPRAVAEALGGQGLCVWDGNYYAVELTRRLGVEDSGGMVRAGLAHYNTAEEVDRLLAAVQRLG